MSGEERLHLGNVRLSDRQRVVLLAGETPVRVILLCDLLRRLVAGGLQQVRGRLVDGRRFLQCGGVITALEDKQVWRGGVLSRLRRRQVRHAPALAGVHRAGLWHVGGEHGTLSSVGCWAEKPAVSPGRARISHGTHTDLGRRRGFDNLQLRGS